MYIFLKSSLSLNDSYISFEHNKNRWKVDLSYGASDPDIKKNLERFHLRAFLKTVFGFCETPQNTKIGSACELTLKTITANDVIHRAAATAVAISFVRGITWSVPQNTPYITQQRTLSEQNITRAPTELHYIERSAPQKDVTSKRLKFWIRCQNWKWSPDLCICWFSRGCSELPRTKQRSICQTACLMCSMLN